MCSHTVTDAQFLYNYHRFNMSDRDSTQCVKFNQSTQSMYVFYTPYHSSAWCLNVALHKCFSFSYLYTAIVLACLKVTTEEIYESVLSVNTDVLSVQILQSLESLAPTEDEVCNDVYICTVYLLLTVSSLLCPYTTIKFAELKQYYDNPTVLGKADQFCCAVSK